MKEPFSQKGFTIIELMAVTAVVAIMAVAAGVTIRSVRRADISTAASKLSAAIRYTYDTAVLNNGTYRMVFDMKSGAWWAERVGEAETCGGTAVLPAEGESADREDEDGEGKQAGSSNNPFDGGELAARMWDLSSVAGSESGEEGAGGARAGVAEKLQEARNKAAESAAGGERSTELRRARSRVRDELLRKNELPHGISFKSVMTAHNDEPVDEEQAEIYFFPSGYVERAYIYLERDDEVYTVETVPLRGTGVVHKEELDANDLLQGG